MGDEQVADERGDDRLDEVAPVPDAAALAPELVGLAERDAVGRVLDAGFEPEVVPPWATALTMDFRPLRVRLFVDDDAQVTRVTTG